jgi:hypothetical protein
MRAYAREEIGRSATAAFNPRSALNDHSPAMCLERRSRAD